MTILEVMGAGVPVVATSVGGVPEVVDPPNAGWLVPPEDPEALAQVVRNVLCDDHERRRRGASGRERVDRIYGPHPWTKRQLELYSRLVSQGQ